MQARRHAQSMPPAQAAQVLWALAALQYSPLVAVLAALDAQIERGAFSLTAQVCHGSTLSSAAQSVSSSCLLLFTRCEF